MNRATRWLCWIIPRSWSERSRCWGLLDGCETAPLAPLNGDNGRQNYPNILENKTINEYCNNWHLFQKNNVFEKCFKFDIILSHVMISDNAKTTTMGFQSFKREKNHPRRGLGLQAFGLGGDHCEGRLFSWSLDRGALTSGFARPDRPSRVRGNPSRSSPLPQKTHVLNALNSPKLGKHIPNETWEIYGKIGWFFHGEKKPPVVCWSITPGFLFTHHPLKIPWTKKSFQFSRQGLGGIRWWWSASQRQCTWWTLCADQLHWQCLYLCPQGICGTNQVRIFADFCWVGFLDGIFFWGG